MTVGDLGRRRCAVLGSPIAHSLSPALHSAAYAHLGVDWEYGRYDVDEAGFGDFLDGLDASWRGLSVTMPLKRMALDRVHDVSDLARQVMAVNTILLEPDGSRRGDNTDVPGMVEALRERGATRSATAAVLGGGATARSAVAALAHLADSVDVYVRTPSRADDLVATASALGLRCHVVDWAERERALEAPIVVATTPSGACDDLAPAVPARPGVLLDVVYDSWRTPLAARWHWEGGTVASGLDLLVHQAALQVLLMTGREVPVAVLRRAAETAAGRSGSTEASSGRPAR